MFIQIHVTQEELDEMGLEDTCDLVGMVLDDLEDSGTDYVGYNVEVNICEE